MSTPATDLIDSLALNEDSSLREIRKVRSKVTLATQGSHDALFAADLAGDLSVETRLLVALHGSCLSRQRQLAAYYRERLQVLKVSDVTLNAVEQNQLAAIEDLQLRSVLSYSSTLIVAPKEGDRAALEALRKGGLSPLDIVTLAQLIAFVSYQVRLTAGLAALQALGAVQ